MRRAPEKPRLAARKGVRRWKREGLRRRKAIVRVAGRVTVWCGGGDGRLISGMRRRRRREEVNIHFDVTSQSKFRHADTRGEHFTTPSHQFFDNIGVCMTTSAHLLSSTTHSGSM